MTNHFRPACRWSMRYVLLECKSKDVIVNDQTGTGLVLLIINIKRLKTSICFLEVNM